MSECKFVTSNSGRCPQQVLGEANHYCFYHKKLVDGLIEPSEPDAWGDLQEEKAKKKVRDKIAG